MLLFTLANFLRAFQNNEFVLIGYISLSIYILSSVTNSIFFSNDLRKEKVIIIPLKGRKKERERTIKRQKKRQRSEKREALKTEREREWEKSKRKKDMGMLLQ